MTQNDIINAIEVETAACVENKIKTIRLRPRRHYEAICRAEATAKYQSQLNEESAEKERIQDMIEGKLMGGNMELIFTIIITLLILVATYYFIK